jgi:hypothetical protein
VIVFGDGAFQIGGYVYGAARVILSSDDGEEEQDTSI